MAAKTPESAGLTVLPLILLPFVSSAIVPAAKMGQGVRQFAGYQPFTPIIESLRGLLADTRQAATRPPLSPGAPGSPSSDTCGRVPGSASERSFDQLTLLACAPSCVASADRASPRRRRVACSMWATSGCDRSRSPRTPEVAGQSLATGLHPDVAGCHHIIVNTR